MTQSPFNHEVGSLQILVADDDPIITKILTRALQNDSYKVVTADNGTDALKILLSDDAPSIAILDWNMPGLTGIEVSKAHSVSENPRFVYKLILSGLLEKEQIIEALHNGAHDVLLKPLNLELLRSRLQIAKKILDEKQSLEEMNVVISKYASEMERLANDRAKQLVHAERLSGLGTMAAGIAHEINNPMSFISGNIQTLTRFWKDLDPVIRNLEVSDVTLKKKIEFILEQLPSLLSGIMDGVERVTSIVQSLKRYSSTNSASSKQECDLNHCIEKAKEMCRYSLKNGVSVALNLTEAPVHVVANPVELEQVFINLITNAVDAVQDSVDKLVTISTFRNQEQALVKIQDSGKGIQQQNIDKIWQPFFTTKGPGRGTGLGLAITTGIIKDHKGSITAENHPNGGAVFNISLPLSTHEMNDEN